MVPTVEYATFCYWKDATRLHKPGTLKKCVEWHGYNFDAITLVHQRCKDLKFEPITDVPNLKIIDSDDSILEAFGIPQNDPIAEENCHGKGNHHYWKDHCINHLTAAKASTSDYILFADSDLSMIRNGPPSWVAAAIDVLSKYHDVFMVTPDEGGHDAWKKAPEGRFTKHVSQQIFMVKRSDFMAANLHVYWNWPEKDPRGYVAPNQPFREFYNMMEGRIFRYINSVGKYRFVLDGAKWRYWHHGELNK